MLVGAPCTVAVFEVWENGVFFGEVCGSNIFAYLAVVDVSRLVRNFLFCIPLTERKMKRFQKPRRCLDKG